MPPSTCLLAPSDRPDPGVLENKPSVLCLLPQLAPWRRRVKVVSIRVLRITLQVQLELPTCAPTCRSPTLTRLARPSESSGPAVVLGVLRHGERADESSSFNELGDPAVAPGSG